MMLLILATFTLTKSTINKEKGLVINPFYLLTEVFTDLDKLFILKGLL